MTDKNPFRLRTARALAGCCLAPLLSTAVLGGTITCPITRNQINISLTATFPNLCVIDSGVTYTNAAQVENTGKLGSLGTIENKGTFTNDAGANLVNEGAVLNYGTLTGGTVSNYGLLNNYGDGSLTPTQLINNSGATFNNAGTFTGDLYNVGGTVNNNAALNAQGFNFVGGTLTNGGTLIPFEGVNDQGTIINAAGGQIFLNSNFANKGPIQNSGTVSIFAGTTLTNTSGSGSYTQFAGQTIVDGELNVAPTTLQIQGGILSGEGEVNGDTYNTGGTVRPGDGGTGGTLYLGQYAQGSGAMFDTLIGASNYGRILGVGDSPFTLVSGALLEINLVDGFKPTDGETFEILNAAEIAGTFANAPSSGFEMDGFDWTIAYDSDEVILEAVSPVSGVGGSTSVPEPSSPALLALGVLALLVRTRWRRAARITWGSGSGS
jgi:hypothetical protein